MAKISKQKNAHLKICNWLISALLFLNMSSISSAQTTPSEVLEEIIPSNTIELQLNPQENSQTKKQPSYEIKPEQSVEDILTIRNTSKENTYDLMLYATDSAYTERGNAVYKLLDENQEHIGSWISFNPQKVSIAPETTFKVSYQIKAPLNFPPGIYHGALVAEIESIKDKDNNVVENYNPLTLEEYSLKTKTRVIAPINISLPGRKIYDFKLTNFTATGNSNPVFNYSFENKGNIFIRSESSLTISGTALKTPITIPLKNALILQNNSYNDFYTWDDAPLFGSYQATLTNTAYEYDVITGDLIPKTTTSETVHFYIISYKEVAILLFVLFLSFYLLFFIKKRRKKIIEESLCYTVRDGDNIIAICEDHDQSWKKVAKINKLKKPYNIKPGQTLYIPKVKTKPSDQKK